MKTKRLSVNEKAAPFSPQDRFDVRMGDERFGEHPKDFIITDRDCPIARCFTKTYANLLGASPELLEALKGVIAVADRKTKEFDAARAAIAKAEGHL